MLGFIVHGSVTAALRFPISELPLSIFFIPPILMFFIGKKIFNGINEHRLKQNYIFDFELTVADKSKKMKGLVDTGNNAKADKSVIFIGRITALDLLGSDYFNISAKAQRMEISTAAGKKNIILLPGKIELYFNGDEHIFKDVQVGISDIKNKEYEAILPLSVLDKEPL